MFIEPQRLTRQKGWIEVICGSMFSGKTEELIRPLKRAQIAHRKVAVFKPAIDIRYGLNDMVSHDATRMQAIPVEHSGAIQLLAADAEVVGIDEAQFFDDQLPPVAESLARNGVRVIIAGLDLDYQGRPFDPMPALLAGAEYITKLHAICMQCGDIAGYSYRKTDDTGKILLGEKETYEPRCRACFYGVG